MTKARTYTKRGKRFWDDTLVGLLHLHIPDDVKIRPPSIAGALAYAVNKESGISEVGGNGKRLQLDFSEPLDSDRCDNKVS